MGASREQLVIGGRCFVRTRLSAAGGAAVAYKTTPVVVRDVSRGGAEVEFAGGKRRTLSFGELEPDHDWLAEHAKKEAAKRERIRREALAIPSAPPPLTYTLADKLQEEEEEAPQRVSEQTRAQALQQIEALRAAPAAPRDEGLSEEEKRAAVALYRAERDKGTPALEVARQLGIPYSTLHAWEQQIRAGVPLNRKAGRQKGCSDHPPELHAQALKLARTGMTHSAIAAQLGGGLSQSTVSRWVRQAKDDAQAPKPAETQPAEQAKPVEPPPPFIEAPPPPPVVDDALQQEVVTLRAENERLRAKVKMLLSMVEGL